jgi:hypothetical protein
MGDMSTNRLGSPYTDKLAAFHTNFDVERYLLAVIDAGAALREFGVLDLAGFDSMSPELREAFNTIVLEGIGTFDDDKICLVDHGQAAA